MPENSKFCDTCGSEASSKEIQQNNESQKSKQGTKGCLSVVGGIIVFFVFMGFFLGGNDPITNHTMQSIENKVAEDAVTQYEIAKNQGDKIQTCVQAGLVSASFLQAKDEENYNKWKAIEKQDCKAAGL